MHLLIRCTWLERFFMAITFHVDAELHKQIDKVAESNGMSRSAFIKSCIADKLNYAELPDMKGSKSDKNDRKRIYITITKFQWNCLHEMGKADAIGITDVVKKIVFKRLSKGNFQSITSEKAKLDLEKFTKAVNAVGNNINQSTRALKASNQEDSGIKTLTIINSFEQHLLEMKSLLKKTSQHVDSYIDADAEFWRGIGSAGKKK